MSWTARLFVFLVILFVLVALVPPVRSMLAAVLGPAGLAGLQGALFTVVWVLRTIVKSHTDILKSLLTPRDLLFPSLEDDLRAEEDLKRKRAVD